MFPFTAGFLQFPFVVASSMDVFLFDSEASMRQRSNGRILASDWRDILGLVGSAVLAPEGFLLVEVLSSVLSIGVLTEVFVIHLFAGVFVSVFMEVFMDTEVLPVVATPTMVFTSVRMKLSLRGLAHRRCDHGAALVEVFGTNSVTRMCLTRHPP